MRIAYIRRIWSLTAGNAATGDVQIPFPRIAWMTAYRGVVVDENKEDDKCSCLRYNNLITNMVRCGMTCVNVSIREVVGPARNGINSGTDPYHPEDEELNDRMQSWR